MQILQNAARAWIPSDAQRAEFLQSALRAAVRPRHPSVRRDGVGERWGAVGGGAPPASLPAHGSAGGTAGWSGRVARISMKPLEFKISNSVESYDEN